MPWQPVEPATADPPPARAAHGVVGLLLVALSVAALARTEASAPAAPAAHPAPTARTLPPVPAPATAQLRRQGVIDLNRAEPGDLQLLPGIGPRLSARIVADRTAHGPYRRVDDLQRVSGIGPRTLERLRPLVCIAPCTSDRR